MGRLKWTLRRGCFLLALLAAGCEPLVFRAPQQSPPDDYALTASQVLLAKVAEDKPEAPVAGNFNGEAVVVDYSPGESGACATLLVTYQNLSYSETWEACGEGRIRRASGEAGVLPKNEEFKSVRRGVVQGAWKLGEAQAVYADFEVYGEAVGKPDAGQCQTVELTIIQNDKTLETSHARACGEP
ncbi:hypothetical protein [Methyloterricola oryzae]|uniref:hypothetical protein n=1 Tax=Methyloterricola oryzae TaxID=1495050 RepID=UPI0011AECECD|nr:hypothetical protein [Methyloterricola oryzae]